MRQIGLARLGQEVFCRDVEGRPLTEPLPMSTFHAELQPVIDRLLKPIKDLLRDIPASIGAEVIEDGIFLTGGGALLPGMSDAVGEASAIAARTVAEPLNAVIDGAQVMLPLAATLNLWKTRGKHRRSGTSTPPDFTFAD
jgi:actin-like ATPase involved in cell morphogenesis